MSLIDPVCIFFTYFPSSLFFFSKCCLNPAVYLYCAKGKKEKDISSGLGPREEWAHIGNPGLSPYFKVN